MTFVPVEQLEFLSVVEMQNDTATLENSFGSFLTLFSKHLSYSLAVLLLGIYVRGMETYAHEDLYVNVYRSFIIAPNWKQSRYP